MKDLQGRKYLKIADAKVGQQVQVDGGFTCMDAHAFKIIQQDDGELYVECEEGKHNLDGQIERDSYVGIYPS